MLKVEKNVPATKPANMLKPGDLIEWCGQVCIVAFGRPGHQVVSLEDASYTWDSVCATDRPIKILQGRLVIE